MSLANAELGIAATPRRELGLVRGPVPRSAALVEVLRGPARVRERLGLLDDFLRYCDDAQSLGNMTVWLRDVNAQRNIPLVAVVREDEAVVAVLLGVETTVGSLASGLAYCGNVTGHRGVFAVSGASSEERMRWMLAAANALVRSGLFTLLVSLKDIDLPANELSLLEREVRANVLARGRREVYDTFDLGASFDSSLARLGAHTRRNLRYYRRRAERELCCEFHHELQGADLRDAVLDLHESTQDEMPAGVLKNRIAHVARRPEAFCMGVRANDGRWLSWVSGWRSGKLTYIDWQCNRDGLAKYSLSTVMRSHLIEAESRREQTQIRFLGGTPHTMHYGFREDVCTDWVFVAPGVRGGMVGLGLKWTARLHAWRKDRGGSDASDSSPHRAARRHRVTHLVARMVGVLLRG